MHFWRYDAIRFSRRIPLPDDVDADQAAATFENGVLEITMPALHSGDRRRGHPIEIA